LYKGEEGIKNPYSLHYSLGLPVRERPPNENFLYNFVTQEVQNVFPKANWK
jgi:hypothetical protein